MTEKQPSIDLTLIILNYNGQFWLEKTLTSLKKYYLDKTKLNVEIVVVDNASTDESVEMIEKQFKWVELIKLDQNIGFAAGNNRALAKIKSDYVMLLNNDVELTEQSNFDLLVEFMKLKSEVGMITPKLMLDNGKLDLASHRGEPTPWASFTYFSRLEKIFPSVKFLSGYHQLYKNLDRIHTIDACSGAAMMVDSKKMRQVGLFDEQFFMYAEDLDWCKRFREAGFKIVYFPLIELIHHKYKSGIKSPSRGTAKKIKRQFWGTMLKYYDKHYKNRYPRAINWLIKAFIFIKRGGV
jgi:GT2 family glycosyltransferase